MGKIVAACPICKSEKTLPFSKVSDVEYYSTNHIFEYLECEVCNIVFLKNPPLDRLNEIYPDSYYSIEGPSSSANWLMSQLQFLKARIEKRLFSKCLGKVSGENLNCLDIGGGSGWITNLIRDSDQRVKSTTVLDINSASKEIAVLNGHNFICDVIENISMKAKFDFVIMLNLIEHVNDPRKVLLSTHAAMKSDGLLLIKTPNTKSLNRLLFKNFYWGGLHAPRHWVLFNKANFISLIEDCGFSVEFFRFTQGAPQWAASIIGSIRLFMGNRCSRLPIHRDKFFAPLNLIFAIFDYLLILILKTDQMIILLRKK